MMMKSKLVLTLALCGLLWACDGQSQPKPKPPSEKQTTAQAMFAERCKKAGVTIHKTVENVEGFLLMKLRPKEINLSNQFALDDPYGKDLSGDGYIAGLLKNQYHSSHSGPSRPGAPPRIGYEYVELIDPQDGKRYRYTGSIKATRRKDANAPNVQKELQRNPNYDLNIYDFVLDKVPAPGAMPRYGVTYDDISTREEREYWIAGSSLRVVDLQTNEVIAERIGYMMDWAQGSNAGNRSPWLLAANNACPKFADLHGASAQPYQALDFVEKVLKHSSGK